MIVSIFGKNWKLIKSGNFHYKLHSVDDSTMELDFIVQGTQAFPLSITVVYTKRLETGTISHREGGPQQVTFTYHGNNCLEDIISAYEKTTTFSKEYWTINDKYHRLDGPAIVNAFGCGWWVNNCFIDGMIRPWAKEMNIDLDNLSDDDKLMIRLYWEDFNE